MVAGMSAVWVRRGVAWPEREAPQGLTTNCAGWLGLGGCAGPAIIVMSPGSRPRACAIRVMSAPPGVVGRACRLWTSATTAGKGRPWAGQHAFSEAGAAGEPSERGGDAVRMSLGSTSPRILPRLVLPDHPGAAAQAITVRRRV